MQSHQNPPSVPSRTDEPMSEVGTIRFCGASGILGAGLLLAGDWLMLGTFSDARTFAAEWLTILAAMPAWRVTAGAIVGPLGAFLYVVGFWQLYVAVRPAGRALAFVTWAGFSIGFIYAAGAFHASFPFMAYAAQATRSAESGGLDTMKAMSEPTFGYALTLFEVTAAPSLVGCLALAYAVLGRPTRYPRWAIAFNPIVLYVGTLAFRFVPAPLGGLLYIGYGNLLFLAFFSASTAVLWNGGVSRQSGTVRRT